MRLFFTLLYLFFFSASSQFLVVTQTPDRMPDPTEFQLYQVDNSLPPSEQKTRVIRGKIGKNLITGKSTLTDSDKTGSKIERGWLPISGKSDLIHNET
jgi:hypothetical protein